MTTQPPNRPHRPLSEFVMPYLVVVLTLILITTLFLVNQRAKDSSEATEALRTGLITNCKENGNPLRDALQAQIEADIEESKAFTDEQAALFFPNVPKDQLDALTEASIARSKALLATIPDVNCEALYPPEEE